MSYSQHNRMRLAAGLAIDPAYEISEHNKPQSSSKLDSDAVKALIAEALAADPRTPEEIELDDNIMSVLTEGMTSCENCRSIQQQDSDFQAAWKLQSQAKHLQRSQPDLARGQAAAATIHMEKFNIRKSDLKCDDCKNGVVTNPVQAQDPIVQESSEQVNEFAVGDNQPTIWEKFVVGDNQPTSWEKDEKKPVNVVSKDDTVADRPTDKDESPEQLKALDTRSEQDQSGGNDLERKVTVPAKIKRLIRDEIKQAESEAKRMDYSNREASYFYEDLASMFKDLLMHLDGGTAYDIKKAQIFMTSLMGPMLHKIPAEVVNFLARGGEPASLKSYMTKVDIKPIEPNKLSS